MTMRSGRFLVRTLVLTGILVAAGGSMWAQDGGGQGGGQGSGQAGGRRGFGMGPGGARGTMGTVTAVAADHYTIKSEDGTVYTVHFSANTRMMKGGRGFGPGAGGGGRNGGGGGQGNGGGERQQPQPIKATDIKVGDVITAGGEMDDAAKSIGAVFIAQIDPERVKQMKEMEANYGKTWLAGRVTGVEGTTITIEGMMDHARHAIQVDENTSFQKRRESITLADIQPGMQLRAEGALQGGGFVAKSVNASEPRQAGPGGGPGGGLGGGPGGSPPGGPPPGE